MASFENDQSWRGAVPFAQRLKCRKKQNQNEYDETESLVNLSLISVFCNSSDSNLAVSIEAHQYLERQGHCLPLSTLCSLG